jgi:hypothetical protein
MSRAAQIVVLASACKLAFPLAALVLGATGRVVRAQEATDEPPRLAWHATLHAGVGTQEATLPSGPTGTGIARSPLGAIGFELGARGATGLRLGGRLSYATSIGFALRRPILADTSERAPARKQELWLDVLGEVPLDVDGLAIPLALGYGLRALTTDTALVSPPSYGLTGPRAQAGVLARLASGRVTLALLGEVGAVLTVTEALDRAGAKGPGFAYGVNGSVALHLRPPFQLSLSYREAHARVPLLARTFHDAHRLVFVGLGLQAEW